MLKRATSVGACTGDVKGRTGEDGSKGERYGFGQRFAKARDKGRWEGVGAQGKT